MPDPAKQTVSATEASALFDASPYYTRYMLYKKFQTGEEMPGQAEHSRLDWGRELQPIILRRAVNDLHMEIIPNANDNYVRRKLSGCTRDGEIISPDLGPGAIDAKAVFDYRIWMDKWDGGKTVPREIEIQLQQQMYVGDGETPFKWGKIAVFVCGELKYFDREPIPDLWAMLEDKTFQFFADIANKNEPEPFGTAIEIPALTKFFPVAAGNVLDLRDVAYEEGEGMGQISAEGKRRMEAMEEARLLDWHGKERLGHERAEKELKAKMMALAGDAETVFLPEGVKIDLKSVRRAGYSVAPSEYKTVKVRLP